MLVGLPSIVDRLVSLVFLLWNLNVSCRMFRLGRCTRQGRLTVFVEVAMVVIGLLVFLNRTRLQLTIQSCVLWLPIEILAWARCMCVSGVLLGGSVLKTRLQVILRCRFVISGVVGR